MKRLMTTVFALALLGVVSAPRSAHAQVDFGLQANYADRANLGVGARVGFGLDQFTEDLEGVVSLDWFFPPGWATTGVDARYVEVNGNALYPLPVEAATVSPYAGGGLSLGYSSYSTAWTGTAFGSGSATRLALNAVGGTYFETDGTMTPFTEIRLELGSWQQLVLTGGFLF